MTPPTVFGPEFAEDRGTDRKRMTARHFPKSGLCPNRGGSSQGLSTEDSAAGEGSRGDEFGGPVQTK